jgi:hypothetical protein
MMLRADLKMTSRPRSIQRLGQDYTAANNESPVFKMELTNTA